MQIAVQYAANTSVMQKHEASSAQTRINICIEGEFLTNKLLCGNLRQTQIIIPRCRIKICLEGAFNDGS